MRNLSESFCVERGIFCDGNDDDDCRSYGTQDGTLG